ncbi:MAG: hypothetical protein ED559_00595 [Phycisphaera sp.]|nr:MAG: hypothetical protein ED559_00595 [Phycisphaera sp.]
MRPPLLIHLHIPKNAGTSLSRAIKLKMLGLNPLNWLHHTDVLGKYNVHPWDKRYDLINNNPATAKRARFFEAHAGFGMHERLPSPHAYLTVIREPIDRALSIYHYLAQTGERDPNDTLRQFIERPDPVGRVWHTDNAQVRYLTGEHGVIDARPREDCDQAMLDKAIRRLRNDIDHLMVQNRFDEGMIVLAHELGWGELLYSKSNVTKKRAKLEGVEESALECMRQFNRLDAKLYDVAQELFAERVERVASARGRPMSELLDSYRSRLTKHAKRSAPVYAIIPRVRRIRESIQSKRGGER